MGAAFESAFTFLFKYPLRVFQRGDFVFAPVVPEWLIATIALGALVLIVVTYRRGRVIVEWPGGERNDARLDEAMRLGAAIAAAIAAEFRATDARGAARAPAA